MKEKKFNFLDAVSIVSLYDKLGVGIYIVDPDGRVLFVNDALVSLSGIPREDFIGQFIFEPITYDYSVINIVLREKRIVSAYQNINNVLSSRKYRQLITAIPIFDEYGNVKYIMAMIEKVSDLKKRMEAADNLEIHWTAEAKQSEMHTSKIVAKSQQMQSILEFVQQIAAANSSVLLEGESGTGKEVIAHAIHERSNRNKRQLIEINCAALPEQLLEAELFGYVKGAFTGASNTGKKGLIEEADGSTLFLDEVNSLPLPLQGKLLRALETKKVRRVGATEEHNVNFRLLTATNVNLRQLCDNGTFREDLYYRLNVIPIRIPPLRERKADIVPLAEVFLSEFSRLYNRYIVLSEEAQTQLLNYTWPGNVRELRNLIERLVVTTASETSEIHKISDILFGDSPIDRAPISPLNQKVLPPIQQTAFDEGFSLGEYMDQTEANILRELAQKCHTMEEMAQFLKIDRTSVGRKLKRHGIKLNKTSY